jgi:hypothetical protein
LGKGLKLPRNSVIFVAVLLLGGAVAWRGGLGWWSVPAALVTAIVFAEIYHRVTRSSRLRSAAETGDWVVLYMDRGAGWKVLVGAERCTRAQAEAARRELEKKQYSATIVSRDQLGEYDLVEAVDRPGRSKTKSSARS